MNECEAIQYIIDQHDYGKYINDILNQMLYNCCNDLDLV